jgi:hypothetical protein
MAASGTRIVTGSGALQAQAATIVGTGTSTGTPPATSSTEYPIKARRKPRR